MKIDNLEMAAIVRENQAEIQRHQEVKALALSMQNQFKLGIFEGSVSLTLQEFETLHSMAQEMYTDVSLTDKGSVKCLDVWQRPEKSTEPFEEADLNDWYYASFVFTVINSQNQGIQ